MTDFSKRLTSLREDKGWSKTYVAKRIGLASMQTYANWEYGRTEPDFAMVSKLADLFHVSADYLLGIKDNKTNDKDADLDKAIDHAMPFDGRPVTDHDRKVMKRLWKAYIESKD